MSASAVTIAELELVGLRTPLPAPAVFSWGVAHERNVGLVRVRLDDGTEGWGETSVTFPLWSLEERAATVAGMAPLVVGKGLATQDDIADVVAQLRRSTDRLRLLWSHTAISAAIGAIEMALWDAWSRMLGVPAWTLLGGESRDVPLYAVGFGGTPEQAADTAVGLLAEGYAAVKIRVGFDPDADEALVRTVSEAIGGGLYADANMGWSREAATEMVRRLNPYDLGWLEEPLSRDDREGLAALRSEARMPLAAGENCYSEEELVSLGRSGIVDVLMPDLARVGGLSPAIAGARAARDRGIGYSTHHYASDLGFAAMLALCAVVGDPRPIIRDISPWPTRGEVLSEPLEISGGVARPYAGPGLAPLPAAEVLRKYRVL